MKSRTIHENLDTSFVNLPALIRYLRRRQFAGKVRIELSGYEADIYLSNDNQMKVREYDHIAGRVAEGDEALQRILIRSREPGGIINVHQTLADVDAPIVVAEVVPETPVQSIPKAAVATATAQAPADFYSHVNGNVNNIEEAFAPPKPSLPNLPFEFSNHVEAKARPKVLSADETKLLVNLLSELLATADKSLSMAKLNFANAYGKACMEICTDYPFLMSVDYEAGRLTVPDMPSAKILVIGVLEALRKILDKLGSHPKFSEVHRFAVQKIMAVATQRKTYYQKYGIEPQLKKILGV